MNWFQYIWRRLTIPHVYCDGLIILASTELAVQVLSPYTQRAVWIPRFYLSQGSWSYQAGGLERYIACTLPKAYAKQKGVV